MSDPWGQPPQQQYHPQQPQGWGPPPAQQQGYPAQQPYGAPQGYPAQQQQQVAQPTQSLDDFYENAGGGGNGAPSFKFQDTPGHGVGGVVVDQRVVWKTEPSAPGQPMKIKVDNAGNQMTQVEVTLQTDLRNWQDVSRVPTADNGLGQQVPLDPSQDTGLRRIYLWYTLRDAVIAALRAVQPSGPLQIGAQLFVRVKGSRPNPKGGSPIREYEAVYRLPGTSAAAPPQQPQPYVAPTVQQQAPPPQQQVSPQAPPVQQQPMPPSSPWGAAPPQQPGYAQPQTPNPGYSDVPPF